MDEGRLARDGEGRWVKYRLPPVEGQGAGAAPLDQGEGEAAVPLSSAGAEIRASVQQPVSARTPVGYNRAFLDSYRPNESFYLSAA